MQNVTIPASVIPRLREGAKSVLRDDGEKFEQAIENQPAAEVVYARVRTLWALLDAIGWDDHEVEAEIEADLREHGLAMLTAIADIAPMMGEWVAEMSDDDPRKPERAEELQQVLGFWAQVGGRAAGQGGE